MEKTKSLGLAGGLLAAALLFGGCGVHAGFHIGKSATPATPHHGETASAETQMMADAAK